MPNFYPKKLVFKIKFGILSPMNQHPLITTIGPTAIGKSDLAVNIALHIEKTYGKKVEIISADSRQIYTYLDIGTGKITQNEMCGITHHMLDVIEPSENYSVFKYAEAVKPILEDIHARGAIPILCGGTGFYIDAIVFGNVGAQTPANIHFQKDLEHYSISELLEKLQTLAVEKKRDISHVDIKNKRRIIRAIDILTHNGVFAQKNTTPVYNVLHIGLDTTTEKLRERIQKRLDARVTQGMIEETERLLHDGILTHGRMQTLGLEYVHMSNYFKKKFEKKSLLEKLFYVTWHYAKRQRTWFTRYTDAHWFDADEAKEKPQPIFDLVDDFLR